MVTELAPRPRMAPWKRNLWTLLLVASVGSAGWLYYAGSLVDEGHYNWKHVTAASSESESAKKDTLLLVDSARNKSAVTTIKLTSQDADRATTDAMREAYQVNKGQQDSSLAELQVLRRAQRIPAVALPDSNEAIVRKEPAITAWSTEARSNLGNDKTEFFHLLLRDACDEDGDSVEVLFDGQSFAIVPLTSDGALLSLPFKSGANQALKIRGVRDGVGGITVAVRTSAGDYFCRVLQPDQECPLSVEVE